MIDFKAFGAGSDESLSDQMRDGALLVFSTNPQVDAHATVLSERWLNYAPYECRLSCAGSSNSAMVRNLIPTFISNGREPDFRGIFHPSYLLRAKPTGLDLFVEGVLLSSHAGIITDAGNKCR